MTSPSHFCLRTSPSTSGSGRSASLAEMSPSGSMTKSRGASSSAVLVQQPPSTPTGIQTGSTSSSGSHLEPNPAVATPSVKQSLREAVVQLVLEQVAADGYDARTQELVKRHFATLPTRYALSVDPRRHEDVLLHMRLMNEVREQCTQSQKGSQHSQYSGQVRPRDASDAGPLVSVRRVGLAAVDSCSASETEHDAAGSVEGATGAARPDQTAASCPLPELQMRQGIPIRFPGKAGRKRVDLGVDLGRSLPKPTFGSCINLSTLQLTSPVKASRSSQRRSPRGITVPSHGSRQGAASRHCSSAPIAGDSVLGAHKGSMSCLDEYGDVQEGAGAGSFTLLGGKSPGSSMHEGKSPGSSLHGGRPASSGGDGWSEGDMTVALGFEVSVAAPDRPGLLTSFTSAISHAEHDLDIKEAHVFSSSDGYALQVFVVTSPSAHEETEDLQESLQHLLRDKWQDKATSRSTEMLQVNNLKAAVEAMCYEDWAVDGKDLRIREKLGGGSSGRLYKGWYRGQEVAVKVISLTFKDQTDPLSPDALGVYPESGVPPEGIPASEMASLAATPPALASAQELLQCFKREVSIMRIIRHKNVLQFIGACSSWPRLFIVTELMAKGSIRDVLDRLGKGLPPAAALRVFRDAARGMDFLHRRGIVHRDLKAANLLIDENDVVKVCDFGVARLIPQGGNTSPELGSAPEKGTSKTGPAILEGTASPLDQSGDMTAETGTYRWMAPEVLQHKPYGFKADVFSFGITMWEVLSGGIPHRGLTPLQAAVGVVQRELRPKMPPGVPGPLATLIECCWNSDPAVRPSFSEVLEQLEEQVWALGDSSPSKDAKSQGGGLTGLWRKTFGKGR